jgi:hypothetical protein
VCLRVTLLIQLLYRLTSLPLYFDSLEVTLKTVIDWVMHCLTTLHKHQTLCDIYNDEKLILRVKIQNCVSFTLFIVVLFLGSFLNSSVS